MRDKVFFATVLHGTSLVAVFDDERLAMNISTHVTRHNDFLQQSKTGRS
jgi:hypothetical protein